MNKLFWVLASLTCLMAIGLVLTGLNLLSPHASLKLCFYAYLTGFFFGLVCFEVKEQETGYTLDLMAFFILLLFPLVVLIVFFWWLRQSIKRRAGAHHLRSQGNIPSFRKWLF